MIVIQYLIHKKINKQKQPNRNESTISEYGNTTQPNNPEQTIAQEEKVNLENLKRIIVMSGY